MTVITDNAEIRALRALGAALPRPRAVLVISAHWETSGQTHLTAQAAPPTIHDFRGFPQELYDVRYPAPGAPWLVDRIEELAGAETIRRDTDWGFDHGAWGVVQPLFPNADVPMVAMSLDRARDAESHLELARKLAPLRDEGVLVIGSGNVIHNLGLWRQSAGTQPEWASDFRARSNAAILAGDLAALTRFAPGDRAAANAINSAEHYLPLLYPLAMRGEGEPVALFNETLDGALSMTSVIVGTVPETFDLAA
jgi:4,5-DOPA dioxygenase extradiol